MRTNFWKLCFGICVKKQQHDESETPPRSFTTPGPQRHHIPIEDEEDAAPSATVSSRKQQNHRKPEMARKGSATPGSKRSFLPTIVEDKELASSSTVSSRKTKDHQEPEMPPKNSTTPGSERRQQIPIKDDKGEGILIDDSNSAVTGPSRYYPQFASDAENENPRQPENKYPTHISQPENNQPAHFPQPENDYPIQYDPQPQNNYPVRTQDPILCQYNSHHPNNYPALAGYDYPPFNYYPPSKGSYPPDEDFAPKITPGIFYGY